ncbi:MAG: carbon monoxide dehydrogenase [Alphaproteobacteria bacterium]|nr:MAG: carbon monoxide dehydrogenase [Alphaproteobacteria bacterium]
MKPVPFDYVQAQSTEEALACLKDSDRNVRVLAGGQSLVAMLNLRLVRPNLLVDISQIESLSTIRQSKDILEIGAAVTQAELKQWPGLAESVPQLSMALPFVGHFQTRNKGTVCGSLAHADPSSELPLCLAALNGSVVLQSARRSRVLNAAEFQTGMLSTACQPDEMIVAARYPISREGDGFAFREVARRHGDFAIVALAAFVTESKIRLGIGGLASRPSVREWDILSEQELDEALNAFAWQLKGSDDIHATARYRRELVRRLGRQVIEEAKSARTKE